MSNVDGVDNCGKCQTPSCLQCFPFDRARNPRVLEKTVGTDPSIPTSAQLAQALRSPTVGINAAVPIKAPAVPQGRSRPPASHSMNVGNPGGPVPGAKTSAPNPKDLIGITKVNLFLVPSASKIEQARAMADGAEKYGPYNWREHPVKASIYLAACERHMEAWKDGEAVAPDSGVHHLGHAIACLGIILDAEASGNLIDDRPFSGPAARLLSGYQHKGEK